MVDISRCSVTVSFAVTAAVAVTVPIPVYESFKTASYEDTEEIKESNDLLEAARWPRIAEKAQKLGQDPLTAVMDRVALTMPHLIDVKILQSGGTTVVIACDPKQGSVLIALDPTKEWGFLEFSNYRVLPTKHSLAGNAHSGFYDPLVQVNDKFGKGKNLVDAIESILRDFSSSFKKHIEVYFAGFSKGGAQAVLLSGELMARNFFGNGITLKTVNTFGTPGYADSKFVNKYNQVVQKNGALIRAVEYKEDVVPSALDWFYDKVGEVYSIKARSGLTGNFLGHSFGLYQASLDDTYSTEKVNDNQVAKAEVSLTLLATKMK